MSNSTIPTPHANILLNHNIAEQPKSVTELVGDLEAEVGSLREQLEGKCKACSIRATLIVNYGAEGHCRAGLCADKDDTFQMLVDVLRWYEKKVKRAEEIKPADGGVYHVKLHGPGSGLYRVEYCGGKWYLADGTGWREEIDPKHIATIDEDITGKPKLEADYDYGICSEEILQFFRTKPPVEEKDS